MKQKRSHTGPFLLSLGMLFFSACSHAKDPSPPPSPTPAPKTSSPPQGDPPFVALETRVLRGFEKQFHALDSYKVDYQQEVKSKIFETTDATQGSLWVKKPGKLRWENKTDGSIQIFSGTSLTLVQPKAQRGKTVVDIYPKISKSISPFFLQFLTQNASLTQKYKPQVAASNPNSYFFKLLPQSPSASTDETYVAEISKKEYNLRSLTLETPESVTKIRFEKMEKNVSIDPKKFVFTPTEEMIVHRHE